MKRGKNHIQALILTCFFNHFLYINVNKFSILDQFCHYMFSNIFFSLLIVSPIEDVCPQYIVWSSFLSYPSGSGCFYMEGILIYPEGEEKELQGLSRKFQKVWLESGGVVGVEWLEWDIVTRVLGVRGGYQCRGNGRWSYEGFEGKVVS